MTRLRDYQREALKHLRHRIKAGQRRLYISLPTGTGKTVVLAHLVAKHRAAGDRVAWIVHLRELVSQAARMIEAATGETPGIVMADRRDVDAGLVVGSVQSLEGRRLHETLEAGGFDLLVVDEAHHVTAQNRYARLIKNLDTESDLTVVGATATPYRYDRHRMQDVLPTCAFERSMESMQKAGVLCPLDWKPIRIRDLDLTHIRAGLVQGDRDFVERDLAAAMSREQVVEATVSATAEHLEDRLTLAFGVDVNHAQLLAEGYRSAGLTARAVWGTMPHGDRARILDRWRRGKIDVVTNCQVLSEGFDFPEIDALVLARPTMSPGLYVQQLGRGMRVAEDKDDCIVFDLTGRSGIVDTRQVTLSDIIGVEGHEGTQQDGARALRLMDPDGQATWAWGSHRSVYYAGIGVNTAAALILDPSGSGLYHAYVVGDDLVQRVDLAPIPLREAVAAVELSVRRSNSNHLIQRRLADRKDPWRDTEASDKQMSYLRKLDPAMAREAGQQGWTKGDVALAITGKKTLRRLRREGVLT